MTAGLQGSGSEVDPWLIESAEHFGAVARDSESSGFYRVMADVFITSAHMPALSLTTANGYAQKVIDGDGFNISGDITANTVIFAAIHFKNASIKIGVLGTGNRFLFYNCFATDVSLYVKGYNTGTYYLFYRSSGSVTGIAGSDLRRVTVCDLIYPLSAVSDNWTSSWSIYAIYDCYIDRPSNNNTGFFGNQGSLSLEKLDLLESGAFTSSGWWQDGIYMLPRQSEVISLTLQTLTDGANASRRLWLESERYTRYLGESDASGAAQFSARIRKHSGFAVLAAEDFGADDLRVDKAIAAGYWYLSPSDNGYIYQADIAGRITSLAGVTFDDQPVLVGGITFTPRPRYAPVMSSRRSVARNGGTQVITLDNSGGGGGPVIDGDPAFLEGAVEEVHPMTGLRRALANCEVVAFERRGTDYVAMGSAYSDGIGGFRLETQVYGGGDVFAFAADFPGVIFQAGVALNIGDRIRPALANGYVYEITEAGTAGAEEPVWWPDQGDGTEGDIGTARARARPYYQPVGHGPLKMIPM